MSRHHLRNFAAPSSRESAKRILEGIDEKNRNKRLLGARLQKIAVDARASPSPAEWEEFWKKHKTFQVSDDDLKMETVIPSVEMQREDEKFAVGPHSRIQERLTLADKDVEQKKNLQKTRKNIFEKHVGTSPSSPPIGTAPKIRPPKPTTSDRIRGLQARLSKQKIAVRYESSFGPDLDAIEAFKKGEDYQGYVGKGKNKRLKFEVKGDKLYLHGHNIATKTKDGIKVSNAGFDTGLTYSTLKELGINAKRTPGGKVILHNTEIDAASGQSVFVPTGEISSSPVRATKPQRKQRQNRTVTEQSNFRKDVESRERAEQGRNERELPLSSTAIQPKDQRTINKITGVKSKIPKETRATDAHHIFPVEKYPELKNNPAQGIMLTRAEHKELHDLNPTEGMRALRRRVGKLKIAERLRAFTNTSSFVGNMRYDQDEQSMTGILSGKHYKWCGVPEKTFDAFQGAGSAGAFFNRQVKGQFDCSSGGRLDAVKSRISKLQKTAGIEPLVRKKKKGKAIRKIAPKVGMIQTAKKRTIIDTINVDFLNHPLRKHQEGGFTYNPIDKEFLDASDREQALKIRKVFGADKTKSFGIASITNTEKGKKPVLDPVQILGDTKHLEQKGTVPIWGGYKGSYEVGFGIKGSHQDIIKNTPSTQESALAIDPDGTAYLLYKETGAIEKITKEKGHIQTAKMMSADAIINSYKKIKPDIKGKSGVYDPVENRILDARIPLDAIRLQNFFESGQNSIGFNSITDTRQGPMEDIEVVRSQLKQIEQNGGVPALGFDEGSLEALDVKIGSENDIMTNLLENQRSTGILDYNLQFKIEDNPKFRKN